MKRILKIDLLEADTWSLVRNRAPNPEGITVEGPIATSINSVDGPTIPPYIRVVIDIATEVAKGVLKDYAKEWVKDFLAKHKANRVRINGREPKDQVELVRIISEEIEIGKND